MADQKPTYSYQDIVARLRRARPNLSGEAVDRYARQVAQRLHIAIPEPQPTRFTPPELRAMPAEAAAVTPAPPPREPEIRVLPERTALQEIPTQLARGATRFLREARTLREEPPSALEAPQTLPGRLARGLGEMVGPQSVAFLTGAGAAEMAAQRIAPRAAVRIAVLLGSKSGLRRAAGRAARGAVGFAGGEALLRGGHEVARPGRTLGSVAREASVGAATGALAGAVVGPTLGVVADLPFVRNLVRGTMEWLRGSGFSSGQAPKARAALETEAPRLVEEAARTMPTNGSTDVLGRRSIAAQVEVAENGLGTPSPQYLRLRAEEAEARAQQESLFGLTARAEAAEMRRLLAEQEYEASIRAVGDLPPENLGVQTRAVQPAPSPEGLIMDARQQLPPTAMVRIEPPPLPPVAPGAKAPPPYRSPNPRIEEMFAETGRPPDRTIGILDKLQEGARKKFILFPELRTRMRAPETMNFDPYFADAREALRQAMEAPRLSRAYAITQLNAITARLNANDLDLLRRSVVARDLNNTGNRGIRLPRDITPEEWQAELVNIDRAVSANPGVQEALATHVKFVRTVEADLVRRGVVSQETVDANPHYFHHQIMDWVAQRWGVQTPKMLRYASRPYAGARRGGAQDLYTDYLEVMFGHYARVFRDNMIDDAVTRTAVAYDLRARPMADRAARVPEVIAAAQAERARIYGEKIADLDARIARERANPEPSADAIRHLEAVRRGYRSHQTRSIDIAALPDVYLDQIGYQRYVAGSQRAALRARTMTEAAIDEAAKAMALDAEVLARAGLNPDHVAQSAGWRQGNTVIIPKELALTLESFRAQFASDQTPWLAPAVRAYKAMILNINPIRYNRRNFLGDLERTNAAMPHAALYLNRAMRDSWRALRGRGGQETFTLPDGRTLTRYELASERAVIASGRTAVEVGRLREVEEFRRLLETPVTSFAKRPLRTYGEYARRGAQFREDWLRLASFYRNLDNIVAGKPLDYGVSNRRVLDAYSDPVDRAAKISRDLLGDYGGMTAFENNLRNGLIPFYAWLRINSTFWPQLATRYPLGALARSGPLSAARVSAWLASRVAFIYAASYAWNTLVHPDQEEAIPSYVRDRWHLNTGIKRNGRYQTITDPTALDDFIQTIGLNGSTTRVRQLFRHQLTFEEFLREETFSILTGPPAAVANRFGPEIQLVATAMGKQLWPDPFHPRDVRYGRALSTALRNIGLPQTPVDLGLMAAADVSQSVTGGDVTPAEEYGRFVANRFGDWLVANLPVGVVQSQEPLIPELTREALQRLGTAEAQYDDLQRQRADILGGLALPNETDAERAAMVRILDAQIAGAERRIRRAGRSAALRPQTTTTPPR